MVTVVLVPPDGWCEQAVLSQAPKLCVLFGCDVMRWWLLRSRLVMKSKLAPAPIPLC